MTTTCTLELTTGEVRALLNALDFQNISLVRNGAVELSERNRLARRKLEEVAWCRSSD